MPSTTEGRPDPHRPERRERLVLIALSVVVTLWCIGQAPGRIVPETKLDLTVDPLRFLGRSLSAWDPSVSFGRLQNQAVGYLFPMGGFTAITRTLGLPPWLVQRLWVALLLVVALWGAHRVASILGIGSTAGRVLAAATYALAPATLTTAAFQAGTQLPWSLAPWMLVPLLSASRLGPRRAAALSGLAVAAMGGINATATFAVLPLAVVWFITQPASSERRRLFAWWVPSVALAIGWWLIPLVVTVRYGSDFTPFTERAALTTGTQTATDVWRGTGNWLPYVDKGDRILFPGAKGLVMTPVAIVGSIVVAALGAWGLARRDSPGRSWLLPATLLGAMVLGAGYAGSSGGAGADLVRAALDGPLVVFRNVQKFAPLVHLPLALGLGHGMTALSDALAGRRLTGGPRSPRYARAMAAGTPILVGVAVFAAMWPVVPGRLNPEGSFRRIPTAWQQTADWVEAQPGQARTLLFPGSPFAEYRWGRPLDEPFGLLSDGEWAVRDLIPLGGGGSTRLLDGLDRSLSMGELPVGFITALQRSGIGHLVVRNDLFDTDDGLASPRTIRRLLADVDGLRLAQSFGDPVTELPTDHRPGPYPGDLGGDRLSAIDVYEVTRTTNLAAVYDGSLAVGGAAESLTWLPPDLIDHRAVLFGDDAGGDLTPGLTTVATDSARRRDVIFGMVRSNHTYTLTADADSPVSGEPPVDRWADDDPPSSITSAQGIGAATISDNLPGSRLSPPGAQPFAAFDGDPGTVWLPDDSPIGRWVRVGFDQPVEAGNITITIPTATGRRIDRLVVTTDGGSTDGRTDADGRAVVTVDGGATRMVRVEIASVIDGPEVAPLGLSDITIDGVDLARPLKAAVPDGIDRVIEASLSRSRVDRYDLTTMDEDGHLDRLVPFVAGHVNLSGIASAVTGPDLDQLLQDASTGPTAGSVEATGSPPTKGLAEWGPPSSIDGDLGTAWVPAMAISDPVLQLAWPEPITVDNIAVGVVDDRGPRDVRPPLLDHVVVSIDDEELIRYLDDQGRISIPATEATDLSIRFVAPNRTFDRPLMVTEVVIGGIGGLTAPVPDRALPVDLPCGSGPALSVDGQAVATQATGTVDDLLTGRSLTWVSCEPVAVDGETRLIAERTGPIGIDTLNARRPESVDEAPTDRTLAVSNWGSQDRMVAVGPGGPSILATTENLNAGWRADLDGTTLDPIRVDGWRQGFMVPAGEGGTIRLTYAPNRVHRVGIAVGLVGVVGLAALALLRGRRTATGPIGRRSELDGGSCGPRPVVGLVAAATVGLIVGSWTVLALAPLVIVQRHRPRWLPGVVAVGIALAGLVTVAPVGNDWATTNGGFRLAAQIPAVIAWMALALAWTTPPVSTENEPAVATAAIK